MGIFEGGPVYEEKKALVIVFVERGARYPMRKSKFDSTSAPIATPYPLLTHRVHGSCVRHGA